jgi:hypothetical protein
LLYSNETYFALNVAEATTDGTAAVVTATPEETTVATIALQVGDRITLK